ncbi:DinB family protein [Sphingobacterium thalpophilum]|uniref:DinB family protein n=1 Tax=Sphingobacterium thalpophilum TaxID=259 RepID=UPI0024A76FF4|nr:DinB family protein [Sphingobacterium thalpophilum]
MDNVIIRDIIQQLRDVENANLWIDENFEKKLSQVNGETAFVRPISDLHSIAEITSHLIEWRKEVLSRLKGNPRGLEINDGANWRTNEELQQRRWENILNDFHATQLQLIAFLESKDDAYLCTSYPHADTTFPHDYKYMVTGLLHHDLYHLGQMGIVIKFLNQQQKGL